MTQIRRRERDAVLQSLQAGLVPRAGLHLIQVGRKQEVSAVITDIERIRSGGAAFRIIVGRFGSGKSFFLNLVRTLALQQKIVVVQADFTMGRRLFASGGEARALYSELVQNLSTRARPEGGGLRSLCERWLSEVSHRVRQDGGSEADIARKIRDDLRDLHDFVGGYEFSAVLGKYYEAHQAGDDATQENALRWLRGEYTTKTEARQDLEVRRIIDDANLYDSLKLLAAFCRKAGYEGLLVSMDEMVVLSHRLPSSRARQGNYEAILSILNDCLQGSVSGIGFLLAGTDDAVEDRRRGLYSYEALRTRLESNRLATNGMVDFSGPLIPLANLSAEDLFVLLSNIRHVHAGGDPAKYLVPDEALVSVLKKANENLGAEYFKTPRDVIRSFVGLLNVLEQNPGRTWEELVGDDFIQRANAPLSVEEEIAKSPVNDAESDLDSFRL